MLITSLDAPEFIQREAHQAALLCYAVLDQLVTDLGGLPLLDNQRAAIMQALQRCITSGVAFGALLDAHGSAEYFSETMEWALADRVFQQSGKLPE